MPSDWEIPDCEMYAILAYLQRVVDRSADPSTERVLVLSDCAAALHAIETVWREGDTRWCRARDRGGMLEALCTLRAQLGHVCTMWIPAHRGSSVSAYADALAKAHLDAHAIEDVTSALTRAVTSRPCLPVCESDYDEAGHLRREAEGSTRIVLTDRRLFSVGKTRAGRWVHAEMARTLSADSELIIDRSFIGRRAHKLEARSWPELTAAFLRSARLDRKEDDPRVSRLAGDRVRTSMVMRARVGTHLGMRGTHDRVWRWQLEDEQRRGVVGPATRRGFAGCACCTCPTDDSFVCRRCNGWAERGPRGAVCLGCGCGDRDGSNGASGDGGTSHQPRMLETVAERLRRETAWRDPDVAAARDQQLAQHLATTRISGSPNAPNSRTWKKRQTPCVGTAA